MAAVVASLIYFAIFLLSVLASREGVTLRGWKGAAGLIVCGFVLAGVFALLFATAPYAPLNQLLSVAVAQMVVCRSALGLPAGIYKRWKLRTKCSHPNDWIPLSPQCASKEHNFRQTQHSF